VKLSLIDIKKHSIYLEQFIRDKFLVVTGEEINPQMGGIFKGFLVNSYKDLVFLDKLTNGFNLVVRLDDKYICICEVIAKEVEGQEEPDIYVKANDEEILYSSYLFRLSNYELRTILKGVVTDYLFPKGLKFYIVETEGNIESGLDEFEVVTENEDYRVLNVDDSLVLQLYGEPGDLMVPLIPEENNEGQYSALLARHENKFISVNLENDQNWNFGTDKINEIENFVDLLEIQNTQSLASSDLLERSDIILNLSHELETLVGDNKADGLVDEEVTDKSALSQTNNKPDGIVDEPMPQSNPAEGDIEASKTSVVPKTLFTKL
jgi:hypothetical protein